MKSLKSQFSDYIVYVDESGDHGLKNLDKDYPVFVLVFCIFKVSDYINLITPQLLDIKFKYFGNEAIIFHERDIRKKLKEFKILKDVKLNDSFHETISTYIQKMPFTLIASVIDKQRLMQNYKEPYNPYEIALQFCLERTYAFLKELTQHQLKTYIVCESRGRKEDDELELAFRRICEKDNFHSLNNHSLCLPFQFRLVSKATNSIDLQIADLIARPIGRSILEPNQQNRAYDIIKCKFRKRKSGDFYGYGLKIFPDNIKPRRRQGLMSTGKPSP